MIPGRYAKSFSVEVVLWLSWGCGNCPPVCYIDNNVIYHSKMPVEIYNPGLCQTLFVATLCKHQDKEYKVKSFVSYQQL